MKMGVNLTRLERISIRSFGHILKTAKTHKLSHSQQNDKRVVLNCQIHTLTHGRRHDVI